MSDSRRSLYLGAAGLISCGILLLLFNLDLFARFEPLAQYVMAGLFALGGLGFFGGYLTRREKWWRLIPGWTLVALSGMVILSTVPGVDKRLIPALLFVGLAFAFANIYILNRRENWWAIIPGGFMLVLSVVIALSTVIDRIELLGSVLLVGMGLVFFLVYALNPGSSQWWALIPGGVLALFGLFILSSGNEVESAVLRFWPVGLIALGLFFLWRGATYQPRREGLSVNVASNISRTQTRISKEETPSIDSGKGTLGEYTQLAPGASVEVLSDEEGDLS